MEFVKKIETLIKIGALVIRYEDFNYATIEPDKENPGEGFVLVNFKATEFPAFFGSFMDCNKVLYEIQIVKEELHKEEKDGNI